MEKLITRKEAAEILGISIATLDAARNNGLISYVQYVQKSIFKPPCSHRAESATIRFMKS